MEGRKEGRKKEVLSNDMNPLTNNQVKNDPLGILMKMDFSHPVNQKENVAVKQLLAQLNYPQKDSGACSSKALKCRLNFKHMDIPKGLFIHPEISMCLSALARHRSN